MKSSEGLTALAVALLVVGCSRGGTGSDGGGSNGPNPIVAGLPNGGTLPSISGANVLAMTVNGALCAGGSYPNKPCVSVTICAPGTLNCQTINDILVDTGSFGLRVFKSLLTVPLTPVQVGGKAVGECVQFADGSSEWGSVQTAGVVLGTEPVVQVPVQVIDSTFGHVPASCGTPVTSPADAGYNGILGVGLLAQDCGPGCVTTANNGIYYSCTGASCTGTTLALASQVQNPVALLPHDNNGVIVELPSMPLGGLPSLSGYLVLGIGTQANNQPGAVTVLSADANSGSFTTNFNGHTSVSFLDTGSNALYFSPPTSGVLPDCSFFDPGLGGWFCPSSTVALSAVTTSSNGTTASLVNFQIGSALNLASSSNNVFIEIGANGGGEFDWGLPFHIGRNVYVGIEGLASTLGTGPYYAY